MLTAEVARQTWRYDPNTGHLYWIISPARHIVIGSRAGSKRDRYWQLTLHRKLYLASRVIWLITTGKWPVNQIDHINGIGTDNRLCNLREATQSENCQNRRKQRTKYTSKYKGVYPHKRRWRAQIQVNKKTIRLGQFKTEEEAYQAYCAAALIYHGEFSRL